jgi:hypothetical protein
MENFSSIFGKFSYLILLKIEGFYERDAGIVKFVA